VFFSGIYQFITKSGEIDQLRLSDQLVDDWPVGHPCFRQ